MIGLPIVLILLVALFVLGRKRIAEGERSVPWAPQRAFIYFMTFTGLQAVLYAIAGLLALLIAVITHQPSSLLGGDDIRNRIATALAALIVGLPIWLAFGNAIHRRAHASAGEQQAGERRLFLGAIFLDNLGGGAFRVADPAERDPDAAWAYRGAPIGAGRH